MRSVEWQRLALVFTLAGGMIAARAREARAQQDSTPSVDERLKVSAGKDGFWLRSADGAFALHLGGYIQADSRTFLDDNAVLLNNVFLLRRIRPLFEGTVFKYFDFRILPDWGGGAAVIQDAYVVGRVSNEFQVKAGKFKGPVGLERLQSALDIAFIERAFPTALVPNRDLGFALTGDIGGAILHYDVGIFDGTIDGGSVDTDVGDNKDAEGRLYLTPFASSGVAFIAGLRVGVGGTVGEEHGTPAASALATYKTPGQNPFFSYRNDVTAAGSAVANGRRWRVSPQAYWHFGPVGLLGEWVKSSQVVTRGPTTATIGARAWQVLGTFALTGEAASFTGLTPNKPVDRKGGFGAIELVARYSELRVGDEAFPAFADPARSARKAKEWAVGLNWYPERRIKIAVNYGQTSFEGGAAAGGDREDEKALLTRFQVAF